MTVAGIIAAIVALLKAIPYFDKWFTKSPEQKIEDGQKQISDDLDDQAKKGRPKWD